MYTFFKNAQIVLNFTIQNTETETFNDPSAVSVAIKVYNPDGDVLETASFTYGTSAQLTKIAVGRYRLLYTPLNAGKLVYGITTTGIAGFHSDAIVIKDNAI